MKNSTPLYLRLVSKLRRKQLALSRRSRTQDVGFRASTFKGVGLEFEEFREYAPGDPVRLIDWRVFARSEKLFSRLYREDRSAAIKILVDQSKSMFLTEQKLEATMTIAFTLASLATLNRDQAILNFGESRFTLENFQSVVALSTAFKPEPDSKDFLTVLRESKRSKISLFFIVSDFLYPLHELEKSLRTLSLGDFQGVALQILDPIELDPPFHRWGTVEDIESGRKFFVSKTTVANYKKNLKDHIQQLISMLRRFKIRHLLFNFQTDLENFFLNDVLKARVIK